MGVGASVGYLLFWLIHTNHTEANDEMMNRDRKVMGRSLVTFYQQKAAFWAAYFLVF